MILVCVQGWMLVHHCVCWSCRMPFFGLLTDMLLHVCFAEWGWWCGPGGHCGCPAGQGPRKCTRPWWIWEHLALASCSSPPSLLDSHLLLLLNCAAACQNACLILLFIPCACVRVPQLERMPCTWQVCIVKGETENICQLDWGRNTSLSKVRRFCHLSGVFNYGFSWHVFRFVHDRWRHLACRTHRCRTVGFR